MCALICVCLVRSCSYCLCSDACVHHCVSNSNMAVHTLALGLCVCVCLRYSFACLCSDFSPCYLIYLRRETYCTLLCVCKINEHAMCETYVQQQHVCYWCTSCISMSMFGLFVLRLYFMCALMCVCLCKLFVCL